MKYQLLLIIFCLTGKAFSQSIQETLPASTDISEPITNSNENDTGKVYTFVEELPGYPGGIDSLKQFLNKHLRYPTEAKSEGVQGTVYLSMVIHRNGVVSNVKVLRSLGYGCDEEAIRLVMSFPPFHPARLNGKPVNALYNLPVKFRLPD